jgi:hypothetical protein
MGAELSQRYNTRLEKPGTFPVPMGLPASHFRKNFTKLDLAMNLVFEGTKTTLLKPVGGVNTASPRTRYRMSQYNDIIGTYSDRSWIRLGRPKGRSAIVLHP